MATLDRALGVPVTQQQQTHLYPAYLHSSFTATATLDY